jgi:hypothetical protein
MKSKMPQVLDYVLEDKNCSLGTPIYSYLLYLFGTHMPRKEQGWITFQASTEERTLLERYCRQAQRTKTEVLRELIRSLRREASKSNVP